MKVWGKEIRCDGRGDKDKCNSEDNLRKFIIDLVERVNMKRYGEPQILLFGEGELYGYTVIQPIHTSCITLHTTLSGEFYLNLFSCKDFDAEVVEACVEEYLSGTIDYVDCDERGVADYKL